MAAIESARGVMKALDICEASERLFGIALSGGDYTKDLQTHITGTVLTDGCTPEHDHCSPCSWCTVF